MRRDSARCRLGILALAVCSCSPPPSTKTVSEHSDTGSDTAPPSSVDDSGFPTDTSDSSFCWYLDADGDNYGDAAVTFYAPTQPVGYVADATDCDDRNAAVFPGAPEHCDGEDEDCDSVIDEDAQDSPMWYADLDADGFGDPASALLSCAAPEPTWLSDASDCDDSRDDTFPGAVEICGDDSDNDCAGDGDLRCRPTGTLSLSDAELRVYGSQSEWKTGNAVSMGQDPQGSGHGVAFIETRGTGYHPDTGRVTLVDTSMTGSVWVEDAGVSLLGNPDVDQWTNARALKEIGDVNGDGYVELALGNAYARDLYLYFGPLTDGDTPAGADQKISYETSTGIGRAATSVGDYDGDGVLDLAVSNTGNNYDPTWGWSENAGRVYIMTGSTDPELSASDAIAQIRPHPVFEYVGVGKSLDAADINGDGIPDLVIGAPANTSEYVAACRVAGAVYVVNGPTNGDLILDNESCGAEGADAIWSGTEAGQYAGWGVAGRGDENGDGLADVVIGAPYGDEYRGAAFLVHGPTSGVHELTEADWVFGSTLDSMGAGWSVTVDSDIDADGLHDVVIGSYGADNAGAVFLFYGGALAGEAEPSLADAVFFGENPGDAAALVAGGGDTDGDGFDDLVIGAPFLSASTSWGGAAYIIFGGSVP